MTTRKNFPSRKNKRRLAAIERMEANMPADPKEAEETKLVIANTKANIGWNN